MVVRGHVRKHIVLALWLVDRHPQRLLDAADVFDDFGALVQ